MPPFHIDRTKHPDATRYRRALIWAFLGVALGIVATILGLYASQLALHGNGLWLVTLTLVGPVVIFLSALAFATYMEQIEQHSYGGSYHDPPATTGDADTLRPLG